MQVIKEQEDRLEQWIEISRKIEDDPNHVQSVLKTIGPTWADCNQAITRFLERAIPNIESLEELEQSQNEFYEFHGELFKKHCAKIKAKAEIGLLRTYEEKPADLVIKSFQQDLYQLDTVFGGSWNAYKKRGRVTNAKALLIENKHRQLHRRNLALRHTDELRYRIMIEWLTFVTVCKREAIRHRKNLVRPTAEIRFDKQGFFLDLTWMPVAAQSELEDYIEKSLISTIINLPIDEYEIGNLHQIILERITRFPRRSRKIPFDIIGETYHLKIDEHGVISL